MKIKVFWALMIILFSAFGQISVSAQSRLYKIPARLSLPGDEKDNSSESPLNEIREKFYPVGWSKDGKFAFYTEPADEACGCYFGKLVIQDLRTDKILWQHKYEGQGIKPEDIKTHWKKNQKEFSRRLARYGIVAAEKFDFRMMPFKYGNDTLSLDLQQNIIVEDIFGVGSISARLVSETKGAKTIYQKKYESKDNSSFMSAETGGILISPFEPRAAVVLIETHRGWEGPPNTTRIRIIGTSLINSFQSEKNISK